ncbi:MAG TPA: universal stress protein [Acidimicrobiales bacterium]|nr:universal stress protein [Acidimicrobiales bacterium]
MFSDIVVGTDGSDSAQTAVDLAMSLARQGDATVHVVHAVRSAPAETAVAKAGASVVYYGDSVAHGAVAAAADSVLTEAASHGGDLKVELYAAGAPPAEAIIEVAERVGADLIVVGSKGMQGVRRVIGSVPNSVAHGAPCHVLVAKTV